MAKQGKQLSLEDKINAEGMIAISCVAKEKLPDKLAAINLDLVRGKYDGISIIPVNLLLKEKQLVSLDDDYVIYAHFSKKYQRKLKRNYVTYLVLATVEDKSGHVGDYRL